MTMNLISIFKSLCASANPEDETRSSTNMQKPVIIDEDVEEGLSYKATPCLSSYYSIFAARLAIMVMLAILIGMLTMLTWHFTKIYTADSVNSLAYGLRYELLQRPILRMWNVLNSTTEIALAQVKLSEYVIGHYYKSETQQQQTELHEAMRDITWALFASRKALNAITINYRNGFVQAFHRDRHNNTYYIYSGHINSSLSSIWYKEPLDPSSGERIGDARQIPPDDLINIASLTEVRDGTASWHVAVGKYTDSPLLSAALPVRDPSGGSIVAAIGVVTALKSVGLLMRELVDFHSGYMYLTSREGYLLATSTNSPLLRNSTNGLKLILAKDSDDSMIRSGAEWLEKAYGDKYLMSHEVHAENVMLGKHRYYIDSFFLNLKKLPLVGVIIMPRTYIMGKVDHLGVTTSIILISTSICILAIGCVCIFILTSGVSKAMKLRAELIKHLDARRRAEASSNYKSQFLANMSHELRTPMAAVIGLLDILVYDDGLTNEQLATITQIRKCSTALLRLLNNILDLSKVESGKLVLEETEFDLGRELEGIVDMFSVQRLNHNVETVLDLSDGMPKVVRGDSARVVQIFTNLISNSIKFTSEGYIILRGWCESSKTSDMTILLDDQRVEPHSTKMKQRQHEYNIQRVSEKNESITLWFEVEDTGCGIDARKWETVFESFEQADPSTTRKHGGTGLGLCIVRNLVNKMGGEIEVVKKDGPGTLMRLYLVLGMPEDSQQQQTDIAKYDLKVVLALSGTKGRVVLSQWLTKHGVLTWEASDWNGLTQVLQFISRTSVFPERTMVESSTSESVQTGDAQEGICKKNIQASEVVIVVEAGLLNQSTNIWKEQLNFLNQYNGKARFAWVLDQDTSNAIKIELRRRGHFLMVNKPLYKTKIIQVLDTVAENNRPELSGTSIISADWHECQELDPIKMGTNSSDGSENSDEEDHHSLTSTICNLEKLNKNVRVSHFPNFGPSTKYRTAKIPPPISSFHHLKSIDEEEKLSGTLEHLMDVDEQEARMYECDMCNKEIHTGDWKLLSAEAGEGIVNLVKNNDTCFKYSQPCNYQRQINMKESCDIRYPHEVGDHKGMLTDIKLLGAAARSHSITAETERLGIHVNRSEKDNLNLTQEEYTDLHKMVAPNDSLKGIHILLAEDNPILQRVATKMLEKVGGTVLAVGDGIQAVSAVKAMLYPQENGLETFLQQGGETRISKDNCTFDLILMDCQMPKLDGYEATKAIRMLEEAAGCHIPIVALTAHAMSSDEAKCLEVGMDAYLTKPINCKLMVSKILSLTKRDV